MVDVTLMQTVHMNQPQMMSNANAKLVMSSMATVQVLSALVNSIEEYSN